MHHLMPGPTSFHKLQCSERLLLKLLLIDTNEAPLSMAEEGSPEAKYERDTFPYLCNLAKNKPEDGVHFQGKCLSTDSWIENNMKS